jgi:catechol 2,3-dioxygenase-like lactoylglutathione lyase family enzyme
MLDCVDGESFTRRRALKTIALASVAGLPAVAAGNALPGTAINHVSYSSIDYNKTRDFYVDLFGFQVSEEDSRQLYLWPAGDGLISAKNSPRVTAPFIDHFGLTVEPWDLGSVKSVLTERGLIARVSQGDPHDTQGKTVFTLDPNGYPLQLCARDAAIKPAPVASRSPLKVIGINHISYRCADYRKARDFYAELLGVPVSNDDGKQAYLWFGDAFMVVKTGETANGRPVIDHFAWNLADWDKERVTAELKKRGLEAPADSLGKSIMTKDLNNYPLQLCSKDLARRP